MEKIIKYKDAGIYIRRCKRYLRRLNALREYAAENPDDIDNGNLIKSIENSFNAIEKQESKDVLAFCFFENNTVKAASEHFYCDASWVSRRRRKGLREMAERMFGIIVEDE